MDKEKLRLDKYLWAIRLYKTRSQAADACDKGKVKHNGDNCKAARTVNVDDEYEVKSEAKKCQNRKNPRPSCILMSLVGDSLCSHAFFVMLRRTTLFRRWR